MTRANYATALRGFRHDITKRINHRSVTGKPPIPDDRYRLLAIGLLLKMGNVYTPSERSDIHLFLKKGYV
ncbi:MAG TPA: hypothetical protein VGB67_04095 [Fibrella sp.]|jgi:hypothetical protein